MATSDNCEDFYCSICFDVLQEPFLTECCGQHFCADCIAEWKKRVNLEVNRCPHCRHEPLNGIIDKYFRRQLQDITNDDSEQGLREQQTSEHEFSEVSHTPEITCRGQESSGQDLNEQLTMCMDVNEQPTMDVIGLREQQTSEHESSEVSHTPEITCRGQESSGQDLNEQPTMCMDVNEQPTMDVIGLREQQTSEHESSEVSHTPEITCRGQESSGQDLNEQPTMCMDVNEQPTMDVIGLREQQTSEHEFSEVSHTPEITCRGQESSGQDLNDQPTMCMDVNEQPTMDVNPVQEAMERRVDNTIQLATTVSGTGLGGVGATLGGVAVGAAIGSVVPGFGTLIGGAIGGIAGGISGVAGGTLIGFGVGKITNKLRKKPVIRDTLNRTPFSTRPRT